MEKILLITGLILLLGIQSIAQPANKDFVIVGAGSDDANLRQVQKRYQKKSNAYFILESATNPMEQISEAIAGKSIQNLHIFLTSKPNALMLNSLSVTSENVAQFSESIMKWKNSVTGKIVFHSLVAFSTPEGLDLKRQMEKLSGLECISVK